MSSALDSAQAEYFGLFAVFLSEKARFLCPRFPLYPSFQKLLRVTQPEVTSSAAFPTLPPPPNPAPGACAWRRAGTVARARETVRVPRARAWPRGRFSLTMDRFPPPSNVSLRESRKRIRATSGFFEGLGGGGGEK